MRCCASGIKEKPNPRRCSLGNTGVGAEGPGKGQGPCPACIFLKVQPAVAFLRWSSRRTRIRSTKAGNLQNRSIRPRSPPSPPPSASTRGEAGAAPAHAPGVRSAFCDVRGLAPVRKPRPPGRQRRPGRGASGHAPSRAERSRAEPSASECGRAEPSGPESVGAAASPPPSSPRLRRRRRRRQRRRRHRLHLRGACAGRQAGRPPAGREARSAGRAARPRAPPPLPLPGERSPRPAGPVCPRDCQSPCVCVCVSSCQPPVSARAPPTTPGPRPCPQCPPPPPAGYPGSFCQPPAPPGWDAPPLPPEAPPSAPSVSTPPPPDLAAGSGTLEA